MVCDRSWRKVREKKQISNQVLLINDVTVLHRKLSSLYVYLVVAGEKNRLWNQTAKYKLLLLFFFLNINNDFKNICKAIFWSQIAMLLLRKVL